MASEFIILLKEELGDGFVDAHDFRGDETAIVRRDVWLDAARLLKERGGIDVLMDLCVADYPEREDRFEVVVHFRSSETGGRLRLKAGCPGNEPSIESLTGLWSCANWFEREAYDLFGIHFDGHPNLKRLLCHQGFDGHALRKDFQKDRRGGIPTPETLMDEMKNDVR